MRPENSKKWIFFVILCYPVVAMILYFRVSNFLSLRDPVEVSLVAAPLKEMQESLIDCSYTQHGVLPVLAVYGANASGKSNTLRALSFFKWRVVKSFSDSSQPGTGNKPFSLGQVKEDTESRFEIAFLIDGVRYDYGFVLNSRVVLSEDLYYYPNKYKTMLYERVGQEFKFGRALQGSLKQIQSITKDNVLFVSAAAISGNEQLSLVFDYFKNNITTKFSDTTFPSPEEMAFLESNTPLRDKVVGYLAKADTGIAAMEIDRKPLSDEMASNFDQVVVAFKGLVGEVAEQLYKNKENMGLSLRLGHKGVNGEVVYFDLKDESQGTLYLLNLLPHMLRAIERGTVLVLDEVTTSLHTLLARELIAVFKNPELNKNGAQLIFTTHDTNLMNRSILRRDEIWFAEKSVSGVTSVYPLIDIKTKNTDNIERGYVSGRFGGVPFVEGLEAFKY